MAAVVARSRDKSQRKHGALSPGPSGRDLGRAFVVNAQLLGYDRFASQEGLGTTLDHGIFARKNDRAMQDILYFLLCVYDRPAAKKAFQFIVPVRDTAQARRFRETAFAQLERIQRAETGCFTVGTLRKTYLASACGERFLSILWQLSAFLLERRLRARFSEHEVPQVGTNVRETGLGARAERLLRIQAARAIRIHRAVEHQSFVSHARGAASQQDAWLAHADELTEAYRAADEGLSKVALRSKQLADREARLQAATSGQVAPSIEDRLAWVRDTQLRVRAVRSDMTEKLRSLEASIAAQRNPASRARLDGAHISTTVAGTLEAEGKAPVALDLCEVVDRWNSALADTLGPVLDALRRVPDPQAINRAAEPLSSGAGFQEDLNRLLPAIRDAVRGLRAANNRGGSAATPEPQPAPGTALVPDTPLPRSFVGSPGGRPTLRALSVNLVETPAAAYLPAPPKSLLKSARAAASRAAVALDTQRPLRKIDFVRELGEAEGKTDDDKMDYGKTDDGSAPAVQLATTSVSSGEEPTEERQPAAAVPLASPERQAQKPTKEPEAKSSPASPCWELGVGAGPELASVEGNSGAGSDLLQAFGLAQSDDPFSL